MSYVGVGLCKYVLANDLATPVVVVVVVVVVVCDTLPTVWPSLEDSSAARRFALCASRMAFANASSASAASPMDPPRAGTVWCSLVFVAPLWFAAALPGRETRADTGGVDRKACVVSSASF